MLPILTLMLLPQEAFQPVTQGVASYYTVDSSSPQTSSGELLDDEDYTCAMRRGKFGAYYLVVAENGRSVICKLNDRGPYKRSRVIDLSEAAMRRLDDDAHLMRVKVYKIELGRVMERFKSDFWGKE